MNTDRTQPARPAALTTSAAPAERRPEGAFAALLDAHAPAPGRREEPRRDDHRGPLRRDDVRDRGPEPQVGDGAGRPQSPEAGRGPEQGDAVSEGPATEVVSQPTPRVTASAAALLAVIDPALPAAAQPVEAAAPAPAAPALPAAPLFMLAPEAMAPVVPVTPQPPTGAALPAEAAPALPGAPAATVPTAPQAAAPAEQPPAGLPVQDGPVAPEPHIVAPQAAASEAPATAAPAPVAEAPVAPEAPAAPETPAAAPARAAATPEPAPAAAPAPQAPAAEPVGPAPVSTPAAGLAAPERSVPLHRAPAAVGTLLHVAVERGISRAKMALRPAELGGIEIRLQATAAGVAAQVVADSPEAARLLAQAGDDLRRALEARDVTLISLEVSTSGDQQHQSARGEWTDGDDAGLSSSPNRTARDADGDAEPVPTTQTVIELPGGLLVDVLA
jgi:flagellar hook-length control protein FliK